jgi:hypothetical protein
VTAGATFLLQAMCRDPGYDVKSLDIKQEKFERLKRTTA